MCGIAGFAGGEPPEAPLLERMAETMVKRGPDGQGIWRDTVAGLCVRRLAIIDLHERSNQPFHLGRKHLVFNGEIYNYKELRTELEARGHSFVTEGDGEVLLHAWAEWDEAALDRLNGMFALAVWDEDRRELVLAADPFGEKPLYYAERDGRIVFGSTIGALAEDPSLRLQADEDAVGAFVARAVMPSFGHSFFRGIRRLPGAHILRWGEGRSSVRRYWSPGRVDIPDSYDDAVTRLRELLLDSIRLRLRSDVPVGTSLSGGIDSSTIVALSAKLAGDHTRHAFTARFPGYSRDEWHYAQAVARSAGVAEHHAVEPTPEELLHDLGQFVRDQEEPVNSLSVYAQWQVMARAHAEEVTVLLDGQGGDELFAGYESTAGFALRADGLRSAVEHLVSRPDRTGDVGRSLAQEHLPGFARRAYWRRVSSPYASDGAVSSGVRPERLRESWMRQGSPLIRELYTQSFDTSLPELLRYADRSSMAWSRELRLPLLDRRVAELAFSLPAAWLYTNGTSKRILRDAGRALVPEEVLRRRDKIGYEPPQETWLLHPELRDHVATILLDARARDRGLYDVAEIEKDTRTGTWRDSLGIWRALNAELWLREFVDSAPGGVTAPLAPLSSRAD